MTKNTKTSVINAPKNAKIYPRLMIKRSKAWEKFEKEYIRNSKVDYQKNLQIFEAMYREAKSLGALPPKNPLEGIEKNIRIAKAINSV